jgi:hypothetical protein
MMTRRELLLGSAAMATLARPAIAQTTRARTIIFIP